MHRAQTKSYFVSDYRTEHVHIRVLEKAQVPLDQIFCLEAASGNKRSLGQNGLILLKNFC